MITMMALAGYDTSQFTPEQAIQRAYSEVLKPLGLEGYIRVHLVKTKVKSRVDVYATRYYSYVPKDMGLGFMHTSTIIDHSTWI